MDPRVKPEDDRCETRDLVEKASGLLGGETTFASGFDEEGIGMTHFAVKLPIVSE